MKAVADTHHLQRRGAVWHYYRRVPDALAEALGRRFIKRSLGVTSLADARKLRTIEDLKTDALFAAVEKGNASAPKEAKHSLAALIEHVRSTVEQLDKRSAEALASDPISGHEELYDIWQEADEELCILTNPGDPRQYELVARTSQKILGNAGAAVTGNMTTAQFAEIVRRGLIELSRRKIDRLENRYERTYYDNLFNPQRPPAVTARELANIFIGEKVEQHGQNQVSQKRTDKIKAAIDTILEIISDETPVHAIDADVVQRVRSCLSRMPNNRLKIYPKLTIDEAIARAGKEGRPTLAPPTQQVYLDVLRDLLQVAKRCRSRTRLSWSKLLSAVSWCQCERKVGQHWS